MSESIIQNVRNEQVQEILDKIPSWIFRWGNSLILLFVVILLITSWIIKYPDIETAKIVITTSEIQDAKGDTTVSFGEIRSPSLNLMKIKEGQKVMIHLNNYPSIDFGILIGRIESISYDNSKSETLVVVSLPNNLESNYGHTPLLAPNLEGTAEIVTEDLRFIERIFYQLRNMFLPSSQ